MAKKGGLGRTIAALTVLGAAAAGISYLLQYKSFHEDLEEDFHEFEGENDFVDESSENQNGKKRKYTQLNAVKDEFIVAAKDKFSAVKEKAGETIVDYKEKAQDFVNNLKSNSPLFNSELAKEDFSAENNSVVSDTDKAVIKDVSENISGEDCAKSDVEVSPVDCSSLPETFEEGTISFPDGSFITEENPEENQE